MNGMLRSSLGSQIDPQDHLLRGVRTRLMNAIVVVVATIALPVVVASVYRTIDIGFQPVILAQIFALIAFLGLAVFRNHIPFWLQATVFFILIPVNGVIALLAFGLTGQGVLMFLAWTAVISVFLGRNWGMAAVSLGSLSLAVVGIAVVRGWAAFDIDLAAYSITSSSWINAVVGYTFWSFLVTGCVGTSHGELVGALRSVEKRSFDLEQSNDRLRQLASQLATAEDSERRRLATILHDGIGQKLFAAKLRLGALSIQEQKNQPTNRYDEVLQLIDEAIERSRDLTQEFFPQILYEGGLAAALEWLTDEHRRLQDVAIICEGCDRKVEVDEGIAHTLFQAARELLHNVAKHAQAEKISVGLEAYETEVKVTIKDDGVGFDTGESAETDEFRYGFGLFNIHERMQHIGGQLEVHSRHSEGTKAVLTAPLRIPREAL